jgi:DNA-binding transcriptional regulator YiaG
MTKNFKGILNLNYIEIKNVPVAKSDKHGILVHASVQSEMEKIAARAILQRHLPIRGKEVHFFRKVLGLSQSQLGAEFKKSAIMVLKWEKKKDVRLSLPNELAVRAVFSRLLGLRFDLAEEFRALLDAKLVKSLVVDYAEECAQLEMAGVAVA